MSIDQEVEIRGIGSVPVSHLCGWGVWKSQTEFDHRATQQLVRDAFDLWGDERDGYRILPKLNIVGASPYKSGQRSMLWEVGRKLLNADPPNYAQQVGDCCSFGTKNAIEYVQFFPMANGQRLKWTMVFPPYLWGCARIFIGNNQLGNQDGSIGAWQAKAAMQYGAIAKDADGVPEYSGSVARQWGNKPGPNQKWVELGKQHIIKSVAAVTTWEELVQSLCNGYSVGVASNVGFDMAARSDGFFHYSTHWGHMMCFIGVDDDPGDPYVCLLNSWSDVFGQVKDFKTGDIWPKGTLRVRKKDVLEMLKEGDSFAYSSFDGFPAQEIDRDKFDLW